MVEGVTNPFGAFFPWNHPRLRATSPKLACDLEVHDSNGPGIWKQVFPCIYCLNLFIVDVLLACHPDILASLMRGKIRELESLVATRGELFAFDLDYLTIGTHTNLFYFNFLACFPLCESHRLMVNLNWEK